MNGAVDMARTLLVDSDVRVRPADLAVARESEPGSDRQKKERLKPFPRKEMEEHGGQRLVTRSECRSVHLALRNRELMPARQEGYVELFHQDL